MPNSARTNLAIRTESHHLGCVELGKGNLRIAHEHLNFGYVWETEGRPAAELWEQGYSLYYIADYIKRPVDETFLLLWDMAERGDIKIRAGYLWGVM